MSLPKKLLKAVKEDKEMIALKLQNLKESLVTGLSNVTKSVEEGPIKKEGNQETAFSSIIAQGKLAEEDLKISELVKELQTNLAKTRGSLDEKQISAVEEQIELLKGDKLANLEAKMEARKLAEQNKEALEKIAEGQYDLIKEFKSGYAELRGEGTGGLIKMLLIGIPMFLAGLTVGIIKEVKLFASLITGKFLPFLKSFKSVQLIFDKFGSALKAFKASKFFTGVQKIITNIAGKVANLFKVFKSSRFFRQARILFSRKGTIGKFFIGIMKSFKGIFSAGSAFAKSGGMIANVFKNLINYAKFAFKLGAQFAKFLGPIGIAITVITGLIGGIKGAFKGFKEDGIVGMLREGIIGVFNALIGGLVKMVGSLIGGIFKLLGFEKIGEGIKTGFSDFIDGIVGAFRGLANIIGGIFTLNIGMLKEGVGQILDGILNVVIGFVKGIGGIIVGALAAILKGAFALLIKLPIAIIKFMAKAWKFIYFDLPIMAFKLIFKALKFLLIDLPIKLIKFMAKAWKFIYFDLPIMAFKLIFKALKFILFDLPLKLIGFAAKILKAIFIDLPLAAFKAVFDGVKFLFIGLPTMLIDKVKSFFTSMVDSIGEAFSTAFGFVKRIGKASKAALKAALPGGESPKEAFMRVMGGDKGGEEKEEKENAEKIKESTSTATATATASEAIIPLVPKQKETVEDFESRMMASVNGTTPTMAMGESPSVNGTTPTMAVDSESTPTGEGSTLADKIKGIGAIMLGIIAMPFTLLKTIHTTIFGVIKSVIEGVMGLVGTILGFIGKLGKAGIAAVKAIMPGGDSPAEAFMKVLTDEGEPKKGKAEGMTPVLSSKTPEEEPMSERDALAEKFEDTFITKGMVHSKETKNVNGRVSNDSLYMTKEQMAEYRALKDKDAFDFESQAAFRDNIRNTTDQEGIKRLSTEGRAAFDARADARNAESQLSPADGPKKLSFLDIIKKAASFTPPGMLIKGAKGASNKFTKMFGGGDNRTGAELTTSQRENSELKGENNNGSAPIIAPSSVNNSKSSVSNVTVAAPPHIDKTQVVFGTTQLAY